MHYMNDCTDQQGWLNLKPSLAVTAVFTIAYTKIQITTESYKIKVRYLKNFEPI